MTSKTATMDKNALWKFTNREIVNSAAGALLYAVLYWVFKAFPMPARESFSAPACSSRSLWG
ncbi:MAG: hypothetical protein HW378_1330 [Anaerolineales bacterium]|nr:hypothetical protein [Anaerolineales bacterium]